MTDVTLLSLPREIRNIIYSYLTHEVVVDWGYRHLSFPLGGHEVARVRIAEAPLPNVLLSCAQIYHEYSQDRRFVEPTVTVEISLDAMYTAREGQSTNEAQAERIFKASRRLGTVVHAKVRRPYERKLVAKLLGRPIARLAPHLIES